MTDIIKPFKFSRSHQGAYQECPRKGHLRYYADGTGYESARVDVAQSSGSLLHSALEVITSHLKDTDTLPTEAVVDSAIGLAVAKYKGEVLERGFDIDQTGDMVVELARQSALVEGLVRAWVHIRLPGLHRQFRVLAVEEEWEIPLDEAGEIVCMVRIDAVLEDRETQDLWPLEIKTTGWMDDAYLEKWRYDSQTLMHCWAAEKHYGRPSAGVKVEVFYKGAKGKDRTTDEPVWYSPFLRCYRKRGVPPFESDEVSWDSAMGRRKGWEPWNVWEGGTIKEWVALMPEDLMGRQLFGVDVYRNEFETAVWLEQTILEQRRVRDALEQIEYTRDPNGLIMSDVFPARLNADCFNNKFRRKCHFLPVCWEGMEPGETDLYRVREPHHEGEFDA